ncbi:unnamed protein product [Bathycoccus prasinos]
MSFRDGIIFKITSPHTEKIYIGASISETSKIVPRRQTGLGAKRHRLVVKNIKIARIMGVLPFTDRLPHLREGERILTLKGREKGKLSKKIQKRNTKTNGITHKAK